MASDVELLPRWGGHGGGHVSRPGGCGTVARARRDARMRSIAAVILWALLAGSLPAARAAERAPDERAVSGLVRTAWSWQARGRDDKAVDAWKQVLAVDPDNAEALAAVGVFLSRAARQPEARNLLARLEKLNPGHPNVPGAPPRDRARAALERAPRARTQARPAGPRGRGRGPVPGALRRGRAPRRPRARVLPNRRRDAGRLGRGARRAAAPRAARARREPVPPRSRDAPHLPGRDAPRGHRHARGAVSRRHRTQGGDAELAPGAPAALAEVGGHPAPARLPRGPPPRR